MKKLIATLLIIMTSSLTTYAGVTNSVDNNKTIAMLKKATPIEDEFVKSDVFPKILPNFVKSSEPIRDELIVPYEKSGTTLKIWATKTEEADNVRIKDELMTPSFLSKSGEKSILKGHKKPVIEDFFVKNNINRNNIAKIHIKNKYDFTQVQIPVHLRIIKNLSTKHAIAEGDSILFKTTKDVDLNGQFVPKGSEVIGRVETISDSDKMGCPAGIMIDNFYLKSNPSICFYGHVSKTGANRSIWVYPLYQAGNILFYVAGFVFVPIHGGHAKLLTKEVYTVYYETGVVGNSESSNKTSN